MRYAVRRLLRARIFAITVLVTLALGIGATLAVVSLVDAVLIRPLPYPDAGRLVDLSHTLQVSGATHVDQSDASFLYYRKANRTLTDVGAYATTAVNLGPLVTADGGGGAAALRVPAARMSASTFAALRVQPMRGRLLRDDEDLKEAAPVVLISEGLWRRAYGSDPGLIGRQLEVDGQPREVVGIMPAAFRFPAADTEVWLPLGIDPAKTDSASFDYRGIGRLRDGVSIAQAQADLQRLLLQLPDAFPGRLTLGAIRVSHMQAVVVPLRTVIVGDIGRVLWVVLGAVGCILLVGCANVANLFLVRAEARQTEIAVRRALGAGRAAIVRELVSEAAVLATAGGAIGCALAAASLRVLQSSDAGFSLPRLQEATLDPAMVAVAAGVTALVFLLVAGLPALRFSAHDGATLLVDDGRTATAGRNRQRVRRVLVMTQLALALVLVAAAGLLARSFAHLRDVSPGFDPAPVYTFRAALPAAEYPTHADAVRLVTEVLARITSLPGVQAAAATTKLPLVDEGRLDTGFFMKDHPLRPGTMPNVHQISYVTPGYFRTLGIPIDEGRTFQPMDPSSVRPEAMLSEPIVRRYWPDGHATGRQVRVTVMGQMLTVVGVAGGVRGTALEQAPDQMIYLPLAASDPRWTPRDFAFVIRSSAPPAVLAPAVSEALRRIAPAVPLYAAQPMNDIVSHARARTSFLLLLFAIASGVALLIGAAGLFGMSAYVVTLRRREIAIRLALGATPADVRGLIGRQGAILALGGIAAGLVASAAATRALAALLFGVSPLDLPTLAAAAAVLAAVALAAAWLPARRAGRIDPAIALRAE